MSDLARSRLRLFQGPYAVEDRVPVGTGQRRKVRCSVRAPIQRRLEVGWHLCLTLRRVGGLPPTIFSFLRNGSFVRRSTRKQTDPSRQIEPLHPVLTSAARPSFDR